MEEKLKSFAKYLVSFVLAAFLIYFAFNGVEWREFWQGLLQTRWGYVMLSVLAAFAAVVVRAERWREMLKPLDPDIRRMKIWDASNIANCASVALPGIGEIIRCGITSNRKATYDKTFGTILMERTWDLFAVFGLFVVAIMMKSDEFAPFFMDNIWAPLRENLSFSLWWIFVLLVLAAAGSLFTIFWFEDRSGTCARLADLIRGVLQGLAAFMKMPRKGLFLIYTVLLWTLYMLMSYFILKAIPVFSGLDLADAVFISAIGNVASIIPVPGGIGAYHYLLALTLSSLYGSSWEMGLLFATLAHESHAILIIVLGVESYIHRAIARRSRT